MPLVREKLFLSNGILGLISDTCHVYSFNFSPALLFVTSHRAEQVRISTLLLGMLWYKS